MSTLKQEMAAQYPKKEGFKVASGTICTLSSTQKWRSAILLSILFVVLSAPMVLKITDGLTRKYLGDKYAVIDEGGKITTFGTIISAVVFLLIVRILML